MRNAEWKKFKMEKEPKIPELDAALMARLREVLPTSLGTAELRELGAGFLGRAAFTARGSNLVFTTQLKKIVDELTAGSLGEGQARTALWEVLDQLNYTPEGGFPDALPGEVPPAVAGSIQDLSSYRRRDLIIRTQLDLMQGRGEQYRGQLPISLAQAPAWELVRKGEVETARDWPARWAVAGGKPLQREGISKNAHQRVDAPTGMIALKGDPVWGELGSYDNFQDALGVDHPPWCFNSEMGWRELRRAECEALGITGPNGESIDDWQASQPLTQAGKLALPEPELSVAEAEAAVLEYFDGTTLPTVAAERPGKRFFSERLEQSVAEAAAAYAAKNPDYDPNDFK